MKDILKGFQDRMQKIFDRQMEQNEECHCKAGEPSIEIGITNSGDYWAEIYSYVIDYKDGGRHHRFTSSSYKKLISLIGKAIKEHEGGKSES